jgi:DNA topoisomerase-1
LLDPGFLRVYDVDDEPGAEDTAHNEQLPPLAKGDRLDCHKLLPAQHFTKPPPYFTDATLIQELERLGIGRPSTFASIVDTLYQRDYAAKAPTGRGLQATQLGRVVCDFLVAHFPSVFEVGFTARLEDQLDDIANGEARWTAVMSELWGPLSALITQTQGALAGQPKIRVPAEAAPSAPDGSEGETPEPGTSRRRAVKGRGKGGAWRGRAKGGKRASRGKRDAAADPATGTADTASPTRTAATPRTLAALTGQACPQCGKPLVRRTSKFGPFIGCSGYPKCRYILKQEQPPEL